MNTYPFTFNDSGIEVDICKVNPSLSVDMRRVIDIAKPKPPMEEITVAGPLQGTKMPNENDPDYVAALETHEAHAAEMINQFYITRGVAKIYDDEWQERVADLRKQFKSMGLDGVLPKDDKTAYIMRIAAGTSEDLQDLFDAIMRRSEPTQPDVDAHLNTFQANVQR